MYKVKVYVTLREGILDPQGLPSNSRLPSSATAKCRTCGPENIWSCL